MSVEIEGMDKILADLEKLANAEGIENAVEKSCALVEASAKRKAPKGTGALRWTIGNDSHQTSVLYIDSPCFNRDIETCRNYGEVRILPNFMMQSCILKEANERICLEKGKDYVIGQFERLWNDFSHC